MCSGEEHRGLFFGAALGVGASWSSSVGRRGRRGRIRRRGRGRRRCRRRSRRRGGWRGRRRACGPVGLSVLGGRL
ncbi:hypothetical protein D3C59_35920 [Streptomyces sp. SHP22-7]|nr:hypothetical protein D3C59_35920 [Streptomyces sp. SHP22-7]